MIFIATYKRKLKDRSGNYVAPTTRASCVYLDDNMNLQDWINDQNASAFDPLTIFPVGVIYQSTSNTSPASLFGGAWEKIQNRFLYGAGNMGVGQTGGEETHVLNINEMPSHTHSITTYVRSEAAPGSGRFTPSEGLGTGGDYWSTRFNSIANAGSGWAHNNMPPYYVCNIWRRTA